MCKKNKNYSHSIVFPDGENVNMQFWFIPQWLCRENCDPEICQIKGKNLWKWGKTQNKWPLDGLIGVEILWLLWYGLCSPRLLIYDKAHWSCSGSSWWPDILLKDLMMVFPLICHPNYLHYCLCEEAVVIHRSGEKCLFAIKQLNCHQIL